MKRSILDFNIGTQLIGHFTQLFGAGFKLPVMGGILLFIWIAWSQLTAGLGDYQISLIAMKLYAHVWTFMEFDPGKLVNLPSPYGGTFQLAISRVPDFLPVVNAWGTFCAAIWRAMGIAIAILTPLVALFVWVAVQFGKKAKSQKHQRGPWLATNDGLQELVARRNRTAQVLELRKALGWGWWLATAQERERAGFNYRPFSIAGVAWPWREEQTHAMLIGSTGTGKTVAMMDLLDQIRARGHRSIVFDLTGAYLERFYDPKRDIVLHPLDARCPRWSIFDECRNPAEFTNAAMALVPNDGGGEGQFWVQSARTLFVQMCVSLVEQGRATNEDLAEQLMTADLDTVYEHVKDTPAGPMASPDSPKLADSVRAVFNANAQALLYLPKTGPEFSIRDWVGEDRKDGSILFISARYIDLAICRQLLTLWLDSAVNTLMSLGTTPDLRLWVLIDELGALHRLPALEGGMQTARNFGGAFVTGVHTQAKLEMVYGAAGAKNLASHAKTKLILNNPDTDTAQWCSDLIGKGEVQDMNQGFSMSVANTRDSVNLSPERRERHLVMSGEITSLDKLHGFLCLPGSLPPAPVELEPKSRPRVAQGFIQRGDFDLVPGSKEWRGKKRRRDAEACEEDDADDSESEASEKPVAPRQGRLDLQDRAPPSADDKGGSRHAKDRLDRAAIETRAEPEPKRTGQSANREAAAEPAAGTVQPDPSQSSGELASSDHSGAGDLAGSPPQKGVSARSESGRAAPSARRGKTRIMERDFNALSGMEKQRTPELGDFGEF